MSGKKRKTDKDGADVREAMTANDCTGADTPGKRKRDYEAVVEAVLFTMGDSVEVRRPWTAMRRRPGRRQKN